MKELLIQQALYNQWANSSLFVLAEKEAKDCLDTAIHSSFKSLRQTFMHLADAEYIWLCRLNDLPLDQIPGKSGKSMEVLPVMDKRLLDFIESKEASYFSASTSYKNLKGESFTTENGVILAHVFNHSTFHRGQIVSMLRVLGFSGNIPSTDLITFKRQ